MSFEDQVIEIRRKIDDIDNELIELLNSRFRYCIAVGRLKKRFTVSIMQPSRVREVTERAARAGSLHGISPDFARQVWELIIAEACRLEAEDRDSERRVPTY